MSYQLSMEIEGDTLCVHAAGVRTRETVSAMGVDILEVCIDKGTSKVLIDVRNLEGRLSTMEAYEVPEHEFPKLKRPGKLKAAAVVYLPDFGANFRFFETVARNRGFNLRVFGEPETAKNWLSDV